MAYEYIVKRLSIDLINNLELDIEESITSLSWVYAYEHSTIDEIKTTINGCGGLNRVLQGYNSLNGIEFLFEDKLNPNDTIDKMYKELAFYCYMHMIKYTGIDRRDWLKMKKRLENEDLTVDEVCDIVKTLVKYSPYLS
jgi:hypothetical protein